MNSRECLGEWFNHSKKYSKSIENNLKHKVIKLGQENSRLTGGRNKHLSITHYSITYLYKDKHYIIQENTIIMGIENFYTRKCLKKLKDLTVINY